MVSGSCTEKAAIEYFRSVLGSANFNLRSWASNSKQLNSMAQTHKVADANNLVNVLGLWWDTQSDTICTLPNPDATMFTFAATKREVLKWTSSIFDPLRLITPVTITAKLFLQQLWQLDLKWDNHLTEELCKTWYKIVTEITQATAIPFPRQCTLHIFADASPQAYGAVAYLVQGTQSTILMSKARAAPLKQHTLPRLELMCCAWCQTICLYFNIHQHYRYLFLVRQSIVLSWITSKKTLKPFVSNRINEIRSVGDTVHQLTTQLICSPEVYHLISLTHPRNGDMVEFTIEMANMATCRDSNCTSRCR